MVRVDGDLRRQVWSFTVFDLPKVYLESWSEEVRPSKRHRKWRTERRYGRIASGRHESYEVVREEPDVPEDVLAEGLEKLRSLLEFRRWSRR